jgi:hypothetical protein
MPSQCTVTAKLLDAAGAPLIEAFVRFRLRNFSGRIPRILSDSVVAEVQLDAAPDGAGLVTQPLWGNDNIDPAGTFYTVEYRNQGRITSTANYQIIGSSFNLGTADPM